MSANNRPKSRGLVPLLVLAVLIPFGGGLLYKHPVYGEKLRNSFAELTSSKDVRGEPSALTALKELDFQGVKSQLQDQWEHWSERDDDGQSESHALSEATDSEGDVNNPSASIAAEPERPGDSFPGQSFFKALLGSAESVGNAQGFGMSAEQETALSEEARATGSSSGGVAESYSDEASSSALIDETNSETAVTYTGNRPPVLKTVASNGEFHGLPIARFRDESWIMRNDGVIQRVPREIIVSETVLPVPFTPIGVHELVPQLRQEFGTDYHVQAERPFVFVSRKGASVYWNERFRLLHSSIGQFCRNRGIQTRELDFPLVVVIFRNEREFYQYGRANAMNIPDDCLGVYSPKSNRIFLFEDPALEARAETIETICHEATHQLASNLGVQQRCAETPLWFSEGLATLFEAPAFSSPNSSGRSPWPSIRRGTWMQLVDHPDLVAQALDSLIRNDNLFKEDSDIAYSVSWGLTHYLAHAKPKQFKTFLEQTSKLPPFMPFDSKSRWEHFRQLFGDDTGKMAIALCNYMRAL